MSKRGSNLHVSGTPEMGMWGGGAREGRWSSSEGILLHFCGLGILGAMFEKQ